MKKFFRIGGKGKRDSSPQSSIGASNDVYDVKEKELGKLHKAAWFGELSKVKQLAKKDASPLDKENRTPLHLACARGHSLVVQELLEWKAKTNVGDSDSKTPLMKAVEGHHAECVDLLLDERADPNVKDKYGNTALHLASRSGNESLIVLLLNGGAEVNGRNKEESTPLHLAALDKSKKACEVLLKNGANVDLQDKNGRTALMYACQEGAPPLVQAFLSYHADTTLKDKKGWTADDCAVIAGQQICSKLIEDYNLSRRKTPPSSARSSNNQSKNQNGFGSPAVQADEEEILSEAEHSVSKVSDVRDGRINSWADSDEESLNLSLQKKHVPKLNLASLLSHSDEENEMERQSKIPVRKNSDSGKHAPVQRSSSNTSDKKSKLPQPVSARSVPDSGRSVPDSARTGVSDGDDTWKDNDESLFASARTPKEQKPSLLMGKNNFKEASESFSDNEAVPTKTTPTKQKVSTAQQEHTEKASNITSPIQLSRERQLGANERGEIMAELGLSDVDDVSDADLCEAELSAAIEHLQADQNKPGAAAAAVDSDWDDTVCSDILPAAGTVTTRAPPTARSEKSDWDSTVAEDEEVAEVIANPPPVSSPREADGSDWDSTEVDDPADPDPTPRNIPPIREEVVEWDSDVEDALSPRTPSPPPMPASQPPVWINKQYDDNYLDEDLLDSQGSNSSHQSHEQVASFFTPVQLPNVHEVIYSSEDEHPKEEDGYHNNQHHHVDEEDEEIEEDSHEVISGVEEERSLEEDDDRDDQHHHVDEEDEEVEEDSHEVYTSHAEDDSRYEDEVYEEVEDEDEDNEDEDEREIHYEEEEDEERDVSSDYQEEEASERDEVGEESIEEVVEEDHEDDYEESEEIEAEVKPVTASQVQATAAPKQTTPTTQKTSPRDRTGVDNVDNDKESAWDSEEEFSMPSGADQKKSAEVAKVLLTAAHESDEDEETISDWEIERILAKKEADEEAKRQAQRQREWEAEERRREEERKREAEEEMRKEQEEMERQRMLEEQERIDQKRLEKEKKEKERQERERREREKQEKEKAEKELREKERKEREEKQRLEKEEKARKEKEERERLAAEEAKRRQAAEAEREELARLKQVTDDDDKSAQIRLQREKAERELEEARARQRAGSVNSIDDEDSFLSEPPSPRDAKPDVGVPISSYPYGIITQNTLTPQMYNHLGNHEEDGLSYSSTENDGSTNTPYIPPPRNLLSPTGNLNDSAAMIRIQEQVRDQRRSLDKERSARLSAENKRKNLEQERDDLARKVEELARAKSELEEKKLDMEAKIRNLEYNMNEEMEKRKNAEVLMNKTKQQLTRKEEQYTQEIEAKQKVELSMRNLQMELRNANSTIKQLEDDKEDLQRQLNHDRHARILAEQINEEHAKMQHSLNFEAQHTSSQKAEAFNKLEEADESRKHAMDTADKLKAELYAVKMELERQRVRHKDEHGMLTSENEDYLNKIDELKNEIKLNEEALAHASMQYNVQVGAVKTENAMITAGLEKERAAREKVEAEMDSLRSRLNSTVLELEKAQHARNDSERNSQRERDETLRVAERREQEMNTFKEQNQELSHRLGASESKCSSLENELHVANTSLLERANLFSALQRDLDQQRHNSENLESNFRKEKEETAKLQAKWESAQDRIQSMHEEAGTLRQQLEELRNRDSLKERAAFDTQDKFGVMLSTLRADHDKARSTLEDKNHALNEQVLSLKEELRSVDLKRSSLEQELRHLQQEHSESQRKVANAEASLEISNRAKDQLETERVTLKSEIEKLQSKVESTKEKYDESQRKLNEFRDRVDRAEHNSLTTHQLLANQSASAETYAKSKSDIQESLHRLEVENAKLESALKHEQERVQMLEKDLSDSNQVRRTMEALCSNLKSANAHMEEKIKDEETTRKLLTHEAEDSRGLWENEVKSKSKLGLRIAQLERQKQEALALTEEEKRKMRKAFEGKKVAETKLEGEVEKNQHLASEIAVLKAHLKAAKKRLKEYEGGESRIGQLHSDFDKERLAMEGTISTMRRQLDSAQSQVESDMEQKVRLEAKTRQLQQEVNRLRSLEKTFHRLEKNKRKLEEELAVHKNQIGTSFVEKGEIDRLKTELEAKSRYDLNSKLEEVNLYLQDQAQAREKLDQIRSTNEAQLRREFEKCKNEMMDDLSKLRSSYQEANAQKETKEVEMKRYRDLYENEVKLRERLTDRLYKANDKTAQAKAALTLEKHRGRTVGNGPTFLNSAPLDSSLPLNVSHPSTSRYQPLGLNDSLSYKLRSELDKSIAKHLEKAPHIDISPPPRKSMDDSLLYASSYDKAAADYLSVLRRKYFV